MIELTIDVTADHITNGTRKMCETCALALAAIGPITEAFPGATGIKVEDYYLEFFTAADVLMRGSLPVPATRFVRDFDRGLSVRPFSFAVMFTEVPVEVEAA